MLVTGLPNWLGVRLARNDSTAPIPIVFGPLIADVLVRNVINDLKCMWELTEQVVV